MHLPAALHVQLIPSLSAHWVLIISSWLPCCCCCAHHRPACLTLLLMSLSSAWEEIGVNASPFLDPIPVLAPAPDSAADICCCVTSVLSPAPACRCLWRRQSWQREGSKILGWNLGQMGSSPERAMVNAEGEPGCSLPPTEKTGKPQQEICRNIYLTLEEDIKKRLSNYRSVSAHLI